MDYNKILLDEYGSYNYEDAEFDLVIDPYNTRVNPFLLSELPEKGSYAWIILLKEIEKKRIYLDPDLHSKEEILSEEEILLSEYPEIWNDLRRKILATSLARKAGLPHFLWYYGIREVGALSYNAMEALGEMSPELLTKDNFDSNGVWAISMFDVKNAWFKAGVGKNKKYFRNIINALIIFLKKYGRLDGAKVNLLPVKYLTINEIVKFLKVQRMANRRNVSISTRLAMRLIRLSYPIRSLTVDQLWSRENDVFYEKDDRGNGHYKPIYGMKAVNWKKVNKPTFQLVSDMNDRKYQWHWYLDKLNIEYEAIFQDDFDMQEFPSPFGLNKKQLLFVAERADDIHHTLGLINTVTLFKNDLVGATKFIQNIEVGSVMTNTKSINRIIEAGWANEYKGLLGKNPEYAHISSTYVGIREELSRAPVSYEEAMRIASAFKYNNVLSAETAIVCANAGVSEDLFSKVQNYQLKLVEKSTKLKGQSTSIPLNIVVESNGYTASVLDKTDARGWILGEITHCCQTIGNVGGQCAIAGMRDGDKGFLVITKNSVIIAESWIWVSSKGNLVLDSVESKGLSSVQLDSVANVIKKWAEEAIRTIFVKNVYMGDTGYGITPKISKRIRKDDTLYKKNIQNYQGYMDGKTQYRIL